MLYLIQKKTHPISTARAVEIVKELVLSYYYNYYLDNSYVSAPSHDYVHKIFQMFRYGTTSAIFESKGQEPRTHDFFGSFKFTFDLNRAFSKEELIDVLASTMFYYDSTWSDADHNPNYRHAWSLSLNSIRNEVKDTTIKTFEFLQDIFNNYDPNVKHFSIYFHKSGVSGINQQSNLNNKIPLKYRSDEIKGTYIDVDRSDPQSVINAIASITYYIQKFNAFVMVKEGTRGQKLNSLVMCFDQRKIYQPDVIQSILSSLKIPNKFLSSYSKAHYNNWISQYNQIFNIGNIYPLYLFHDVNDNNKLAQLIIDSLRIYLGVNSQIIKLQQAR